MNAPKKMAIQLVVYVAIIGYLVLDLHVWKGPVSKKLSGPGPDSEEVIAEAKAQGIAARVYYQPIYRAQVEERAKQYLWKRGRTFSDTTLTERRLLREVIVNELVDELLLKIQIKVSPLEQYDVSKEQQEELFAQFQKRYGAPEVLDELMTRQGWQGEKEARMRLNARAQRENYLRSFLPEEVKEEEARAWYEEHQKELRSPESRQVRQIFVSALAGGPKVAERVVKEASQQVLEGKKDFGKVAESFKEVIHPVDLSWVTAKRLPKDFALILFSLPLNQPQVIQTKQGWHFVEVTGIEEGAIPPFEEVSESIAEALLQTRKRAAFTYFRKLMHLHAEGKVEIFEDVLYSEDSGS